MTWLIEALVASTLLMLLVLALRRPVARLFGAHVAYALWALPALRLLLPPLPGWTTLYAPVAHGGPAEPLVFGIVDPATAARLAADTAAAPLPAVAASPVLDPAMLLPLVIVIWAAGAVAWFGWQMWRYRRFLAHAITAATPLTRVAGVEVLVTPAVAGPMAAGIRHRRILLPIDFNSRYSAAERRLALLHEGAHHDRGDLAANFAGLVVVAVHWWNPVAHWAYRAFRHDQELACDASVLAGSTSETRAAYGSAVLKSACTATPAAACAMNHKSHLKQRITMMKDRERGPLRLLIGAVSATALIAGGLVLTASGAAPAPPAPPAPISAVDPVTPPAPVSPPVPAAAPASPPAPVAAPAPPSPPARQRVAHRIVIRDGEVIRHDTLTAADEKALRAAERDAWIAAERARTAGEKAAAAAEVMTRRLVIQHGDIDKMVADSLAGERRRLVITCSRRGKPVAPDADLVTLGNCGPINIAAFAPDVRESLAQARRSIEATRGLSDEQRKMALSGLDEAMRELDAKDAARGAPKPN